jgi:protein-L-isoaspartate(D-aspartate) O-methyltransferase
VNGGRPAFLALALLIALPARTHAGSTPAQLAERLQGRGIRSTRVLDVFRRVRREAFVPPALRDRAYDDAALDIGHGQTMSQPYVLALMAEQLGLTGKERVLEIGTGSGYDAAVFATLAHDVYSVEIVPDLAVAARLALAREAYLNVHVKQGDGTLGWRDYGPYDAIVVTAAAPAVPRALVDQLTEGGVLVMPISDRAGKQVLLRGVKHGTKLHGREVAEVKLVPPLIVGRTPAPRAEEPPRVAPPRAAAPAGAPPPRDEEPARVLPPRPQAPAPVSPRDDVGARRAPHDQDEESDGDDQDDERARTPPPESPRAAPALRPEAAPPRPEAPVLREEPPARDLNEENLPERNDSGPESDTRPLRAARIRVARAPDARGSDHHSEARPPESAGADSPARARRFAA